MASIFWGRETTRVWARDSSILPGNGVRHYVEIRDSCVTKGVYNIIVVSYRNSPQNHRDILESIRLSSAKIATSPEKVG
jgi:hypothetical protein